MSKSLSAKIKAEKLTTYECSCYACRKPYLTEYAANCPICGGEPCSVNEWRDGNFVGYPKDKSIEESAGEILRIS